MALAKLNEIVSKNSITLENKENNQEVPFITEGLTLKLKGFRGAISKFREAFEFTIKLSSDNKTII
jgi:hypothetical protein